jgi:hypothetical protein
MKEKRAANTAINIVASLLILLPAAFGFHYIHQFGVNVPYWDQWWFVPLFNKPASDTLSVSQQLS